MILKSLHMEIYYSYEENFSASFQSKENFCLALNTFFDSFRTGELFQLVFRSIAVHEIKSNNEFWVIADEGLPFNWANSFKI